MGFKADKKDYVQDVISLLNVDKFDLQRMEILLSKLSIGDLGILFHYIDDKINNVLEKKEK
jgi:hypothetical protein